MFPEASSPYLQQQVNAWMNFIMPGVKVESSYDLKTLSAQIKIENGYTNGNGAIAPNIGFGISYVLPIIVSGLIAEKDSSIDNKEKEITSLEHNSQVSTIYDRRFEDLYLKIIQLYEISEIQNVVLVAFFNSVFRLKKDDYDFPELNHSFAENDKELLLSYKSSKGVHLISIDDDGDVMVSFSGFSLKDGWREFFDYNDKTIEQNAILIRT